MKAVIVLATIILSVVIVTNSHFAGRSGKVESVPLAGANALPPTDVSSNQNQSYEAGPEVKLILLALTPEGFDSSELQFDAGEYLFIIGNRTGLKEVNVGLNREGNERVSTAKVGGRQRDWKQRLKLNPGTYTVTADDNPDWTCRITVVPSSL